MRVEKSDAAVTEAAQDSVIWARFKEGDKDAYASIYSRYSSLLFRYGCKVIADREVVKDCLHDLFTEIWKNKSNLGNPESVKNYLVKSLRNKLLRELSKQAKFVDEENVEEGAYGEVCSHEANLIYSQEKGEREKQLVNALKKLTNRQKEIIFLLYYNNLSPAEVASIMSVSVRTIYNTTFAAIQSLKGEMVVVTLVLLFKDTL
jgi:RNA polymerase sigma factor (sigma-70 family)